MTTHSTNNISRRKFLLTGSGLTIGITAYAMFPKLSAGEKGELAANEFGKPLSAWVHIREDGQITIYSPASEMGQGSMTALPVIFAEELDADWDKVKVEQSPIDPEVYGFKAWGNRKIMLNVGSRTVMGYYESLRQAGAQARYVLLFSVAKAWNVPIKELSTSPSTVHHKASNKSVTYGEIMDFLEVPDQIPEMGPNDLKDPKDFRLIGSLTPRADIPAKVDGSAIFGLDVQVPDMVYGVIERGNMHGSKPTLDNEAAIKAMEGVIDIVKLDYGIGLITESMEQALKIKKQLKISWDTNVKAASHSCQKTYEIFEEMVNDPNTQTREITHKGNVKGAMAKGEKLLKADFKNDYVYHAQMEPLNAVASVSEDGKRAEVWAGTQGPGTVARSVSQALGISPSNVTFHQCYLGGGLGRRSLHDYIVEAAVLSKEVKKPVKLMWTREDDLQYGMYRPMSLQRLEGSIDENNNISAFSHIVVGDGNNLLASGIRNAFYNIPNQYAAIQTRAQGIRLKHWRAVGHGPNKFAIESFIDELAAEVGKDPLQLRRELMADSPRALATLNKAAEMAQWDAPLKAGRAKGIAFGERSGALVTGICELSVDKARGTIKVHHFWLAVDAGTIVQPDNAIAQLEGGVIMGMSSVLSEQLTIKKGEVQQSNFHDYRLMRFADIPESIEVFLMPSTDKPQGIGEGSTPIVAGAIANAFSALTAKRLRHLPFSPKRVKDALG